MLLEILPYTVLTKLLFIFSFLNISFGHAQQKFTITSSRANNYCNTTCTRFDVPDLNDNPNAIIFITQVEVNGVNLNQHPICAYYISKQWSVVNIDYTTMPPGSQFSVEYYSKPDENHFVHVVTAENLVKKISYIDHAGLNNNPGAQFTFFQNWAPSLRGGSMNRYEIKIQFDSVARKWYLFNINGRQLEYPLAYNINILNQRNVVIDSSKLTTIKKDIIPQKILPKAYDFSKVRVCVDQVFTISLPPKTIIPSKPVIPKIKQIGEINHTPVFQIFIKR